MIRKGVPPSLWTVNVKVNSPTNGPPGESVTVFVTVMLGPSTASVVGVPARPQAENAATSAATTTRLISETDASLPIPKRVCLDTMTLLSLARPLMALRPQEYPPHPELATSDRVYR